MEAILRILAVGFIKTSIPGRRAYLMSSQNRIDFFVCFFCDLPYQIIQIFFSDSLSNGSNYNSFLRSLKVLRCLRALRTLRVISKNENLRIIVGSILELLPSIMNGLIVCMLVIFIFGIIGVNLFKGSFYNCRFDPSQFTEE